ncbi:hypothetical protein BCR39DRAFT_530125 [Naematelia encephala]|uniref:Diphthine--ammonia ligase n=1 Tax=Naematelia encephala TaxID=71784 RepID=A0A1Y2B5X4_9TREE|nr:hypothetical protein BCR39DRAFT_530125 [Naematelia encephala]
MVDLPGVKHKVIGLVSGGKDSTFNLLHCVANGHELVAVATLQPEPGTDELDSHMYQSVGTQLLPLIARALGLPLYTRTIKGKAVERGAEYGSRLKGGEGSGSVGDETEDLTTLLKKVKERHPEATALASGAILSNYQRLRIEHVCGRLGLVSLSFLWQEPQLPLLDRMISSGLEAILVKVAGVGLGINLVGKSLAQVRPLLARLEAEYGSHPAGEGGEYETLTLSSPLFSHRLKLVKTRVIVTDPEPYPVAYLKVEEAELEEKVGWTKPSVEELREMLGFNEDERQDGLDEISRELEEEIGSWSKVVKLDEDDAANSVAVKVNDAVSEMVTSLEALDTNDESRNLDNIRFASRGRWFTASIDGRSLSDENIGDEVTRCFNSLSKLLESHSLSLPLHATHITLLLPSMSLFAQANKAYTTFFGTSPPSRATVAVPLPAGQLVRLEVAGFDDRPNGASDERPRIGGRQALHVQGLSYWAPANIGPYSQAVIVNERVHLAGQIPLLPVSLTLPLPPAPPNSEYPHQAILALQHVRRILEVLRSRNSTGGGWKGWGESCVGWFAGRVDGEGSEVVRRAWSIWARDNGFQRAPVVFVRAKELPRGALVEFQVNVHTGRTVDSVEMEGAVKEPEESNDEEHEDEDEEDELRPIYSTGSGSSWSWERSITSGSVTRGSRALIFLRDLQEVPAPIPSELFEILDRAVSMKVYHVVSIIHSSLENLVEQIINDREICVTFVPVLQILDRDGQEKEVAFEVFGI